MRTHASPMTPTEALTRFGVRGDALLDGLGSAPRTLAPRYGFDVGNLALLMPEGTPSELVEFVEPTPIPSTHTWLRGLVNLRGNLVPVFDLAALLGELPSDGGGALDATGRLVARRRRTLMVLGASDRMIGLELDSVPRACETERLQPMAQPPVLPTRLAPHVKSAWLEGEQIWLEFDHHSFFDALRPSVEAV